MFKANRPSPHFTLSMFFIVLAALSLLGFLGTRAAYSADLTGAFTYPTQNTDGTVIGTADAIVSVRIEYSLCTGTSTFGVKLGEVVVLPPTATFTISNVGYGNFCLRAYAKNLLAVESVATLTVTKNNPIPTPKPPVLGVINIVAYELKTTGFGTMVGKAVGTVPLGTACGIPAFGDYYTIPSGAIEGLDPKSKSWQFVAHCAPIG